MVGPAMMLLKLLHCKRANRKKSSTSKSGEYKDYEGPSHSGLPPLKLKTERSEYEDEPICRVCLKEGNLHIFGTENKSDDLSYFAGIEVSQGDAYPKYLCESCNSLLQMAILFRKTAQESDQLLRQPVENNGISMLDSQDEDDWLDTADDTSFSFNDEKVKSEEKGRKSTYYCKKCDLKFDTFDQYEEHKLSKEHDNLRKTCPICNNSYSSVYIKKHLMLHRMETPYMCDICGKKFSINGQFNRHRITHFLDDLPFKCQLCPYRGRFRESLKSHMKTHTGEKSYQCPQCPSRFFTSKSNLNKHMLTHRSDHDFKCNQCQRGFYKKRDLEAHFKVDHTGIKDQICNICGKAFGYRKQMMKHQLKVHKREKGRSGRTPLYLLLESKKQMEAEQN